MVLKSILVTGGAGFIGASVVRQILQKPIQLVVVDKEPNPWRLDNDISRLTYICGDITNLNENILHQLPKQIDSIVHLAAFAKPSEAEKQPDRCFSVNVFGTKVVCDLAVKLGVKSFVNMSALALYPNHPDYSPIDEKHRISPLQGVYAHSKWLAEKSVSEWGKINGIAANSIRLSNTYGPMQEANYLVPSLISKAKEGDFVVWNGAIVRDFNYVDDVASAIIALAESEVRYEPMNLGTGVGTSIENLAEIIAGIYGVSFGDDCQETFGPKMQIVNSKNLQKSAGWVPKIPVIQGLKKTIEYYEEYGFYHEQ